MSTLSFPESTSIPWAMSNPPRGITVEKVYFGKGSGADCFGVIVCSSNSAPTITDLRQIHTARVGRTGAYVVVAVLTGDKCTLFGPSSDTQPFTLQGKVARAFLKSVLEEKDTLSAFNRFKATKLAVEVSETPWFTNHGLFASYHIRENAPKRQDWEELSKASFPLIIKRGMDLIDSLGFVSARHEDQVLILSSTTDSSVVAILLEDQETFEGRSNRFQSSPVTWALKTALERNIPWVVLLKNGRIRLYPAKDGVGVGQRGQLETFFELDLELLDESNAGYLNLVFSEPALRAGGSTEELLAESNKYSTSLGDRLRDRIYLDVVPVLAKAVAQSMFKNTDSYPTEKLQEAYSVSLRILFRLLFQAYAEDRGLLPSGRNPLYDDYSLKTLAQQSYTDGNGFELWRKLNRVWKAVEKGDEEFKVPPYGGGLFDSNADSDKDGFAITQIKISDLALHEVIKKLIIDINEDQLEGPVDFRSLSVREFGTIYEGLLESSLSVSESNLTVDNKGVWVAARDGQEALVKKGEIYFHSSAGTRKSTGSYYTPSVLVNWIISKTIDPKLDEHLERVSNLISEDEIAKAGDLFFDFRVADLAMGSGHFLVAAVDRIEAKMRSFLADSNHILPKVSAELEELAKSAKQSLGEYENTLDTIEPATLLRRQIARRCIYGMDINPLAVELSRLAIWIHTFVPGLPMSSLEHGLVCANSLTGIGQIEEALQELQKNYDPNQTFYDQSDLEKSLSDAKDVYLKVAANSESTPENQRTNRELIIEAKEETLPAKRCFDAAVAIRLQLVPATSAETQREVDEIANNPEVLSALREINCAHFPHLFPEVFARANPGFDAIIGNPPWEKLHVEEINWWGRYLPGLRSDSYPKNQRDRDLKRFKLQNPLLVEQYERDVQSMQRINTVIKKGPYPGITKAHVDLFSAFAWRNWQLTRHDGSVGIILPRTAHIGAGLVEWRNRVLDEGTFRHVTFIQNLAHWAFSAVHAQYTIGLTVIEKTSGEKVYFNGPFISSAELESKSSNLNALSVEEFRSWSVNSAFPLVETPSSLKVFRQMMTSPKLEEEFRLFSYTTNSDLNAKTDRALYNLWDPQTSDDCYVFTGGSFDLWNPTFGDPYGSANLDEMKSNMFSRISRGSNLSSSPYKGLNVTASTQPMTKPRIAFRQITNRTNTRTCIVALIPPNTVAVHMATLLLRKRGSAKTDAFILGILSSRIFDWYIRRWIEGTFTMKLMQNSPIPKNAFGTAIGDRIVYVAGSLAAFDDRYTSWAQEAEVPVASIKDNQSLRNAEAEIDALVAIAFGLDLEDVKVVMETFQVGWDFQEHLRLVLGYFEKWSKQ